MTALDQFSVEELMLLNQVPTAVVMGAAYAHQDGAVTLMREMDAGLKAAGEAAMAFPDNELIQALTEAMSDDQDDREDPNAIEAAVMEEAAAGTPAGQAASDAMTTVEDPVEENVAAERHPGLAGENALELSQRAMAIMHEKATIEETIQFKHWLYTLADQVTLAAKSGGFLGFGGDQVSDDERTFLAELRIVLELDETDSSLDLPAADEPAALDPDDV